MCVDCWLVSLWFAPSQLIHHYDVVVGSENVKPLRSLGTARMTNIRNSMGRKMVRNESESIERPRNNEKLR